MSSLWGVSKKNCQFNHNSPHSTWNFLLVNLVTSLCGFWIFDRGAAVKWVRLIGFGVWYRCIQQNIALLLHNCVWIHTPAHYTAGLQWQVLRSALFFFWCVQSAGSGPGVLIYATRGRALKGKQQRPGKPGPVTITAPAYIVCVCIRLCYDRKPALWTRPPTPFSLYYGNLLWSHTYYNYQQKLFWLICLQRYTYKL